MGHPDDMLQLSGLFFHFSREEEGTGSYRVPMKLGEGMEHVKTMHIYNCRVDAQLRPATNPSGWEKKNISRENCKNIVVFLFLVQISPSE